MINLLHICYPLLVNHYLWVMASPQAEGEGMKDKSNHLSANWYEQAG